MGPVPASSEPVPPAPPATPAPPAPASPLATPPPVVPPPPRLLPTPPPAAAPPPPGRLAPASCVPGPGGNRIELSETSKSSVPPQPAANQVSVTNKSDKGERVCRAMTARPPPTFKRTARRWHALAAWGKRGRAPKSGENRCFLPGTEGPTKLAEAAMRLQIRAPAPRRVRYARWPDLRLGCAAAGLLRSRAGGSLRAIWCWMTTRNPYVVLSKRTVYDNPWITVTEHAIQKPRGGEG